MGKKRIKNLGRRKKYINRRKKNKLSIEKAFIIISVSCCIVALCYITKQVEELYKRKNIESSKIEYYMDVADEVSDNNTQVNWKDLMAIDLAKNEGDLSKIRKKDSLDIAKEFIKKEKNKDGEYIYKIKPLNDVLDKLNFNNKLKEDTTKYKNQLEYVYLVDENLDKNSKQSVFIDKIEDVAIENYHSYGILPSITIAQCILESGWGESQLSKTSNNLFGIKADKRWDGDSIEASTSENYNDKIVASFRVYDNVSDSIKDHGEFLDENKRYTEHGLFEAKHYTSQAQALENAGYSTKKDDKGEPIYADMLINLIRSYGLQAIDSEVQVLK